MSLRVWTIAVALVAALAALSCTERSDPPTPTVPIAMPPENASLEDVVALAREYAEKRYGRAGPIWLHHVNAPAVNADGTVVIGDLPIEIVFTMRRYHGPNVCERLDLTRLGWTERNDGCDPQGVQAHCTAREALERARATGAASVRLAPVQNEGFWTVQQGSEVVEVADDCGL